MSEEQRLRQIKIQVWLLEEEKEMLKMMAYEYGLTMSDCVRKLIIAQRLSEKHWTMAKEVGEDLVREVNEIGNSVNKIAYYVDEKTFVEYSDFMALKESYLKLLDCIGELPFLTHGEVKEWRTLTYTLSRKLLGSQLDT